MELKDLAGLGQLGCKLLEILEKGTGWAVRPHTIKRDAKAQAAVNVMMAHNAVEVSAIEHRAAQRLAMQEVQRQENIEAIMLLAAAVDSDSVSEEPVDADWATAFFDSCKDISNHEMRLLWARILAGETVRPASFSLRTLAVVKTLRRQEAEVFTRLCRHVWQVGGDTVPVLLSHDGEEDCSIAGFNFDHYLDLEAAGLIRHSTGGNFGVKGSGWIEAAYGGRRFAIGVPSYDDTIPIGEVLLTLPGRELLGIVDCTPDLARCDEVLRFWQCFGLKCVGLLKNADIDALPPL